MNPNKNLHFIGVGGSGMSALAQIAASDHSVSGSDRTWSPEKKSPIFQILAKNNVRLFAQDGSGIHPKIDQVVYSTAIETDNPDWVQAQKLKIDCVHRSDFLSECVKEKKLIAIGGTSGKSTITGMVGVLLEESHLSPSVINGGEIKNFISASSLGNAKAGSGDYFVIESDESDGSLTRFFPATSVIANISKDHKTIEELRELFLTFAKQTQKTLVLNQDCNEVRNLNWPQKNKITYGLHHPADIEAKEIKFSLTGSSFKVKNTLFQLQVPGEHNVSNALAAIATGLSIGLDLEQMAPALSTFKGIKRRLDFIHSNKRYKVFDDFAHNPEKIQASLTTLSPYSKRIIAIFQPHGYGPTRFLFEEYVDMFAKYLRKQDQLYLLPIFDAGGTANRTIRSEDLTDKVVTKNRSAKTSASRSHLLKDLKELITEEDTILVMGARDPSLTQLCEDIASLN